MIEGITYISNIKKIVTEINVAFATKVRDANRHNYSKTFYLCREFIIMNIYNELSLTILANELHISEGYLSTKFKKECNIGMNDFIQK